LKNVDNEVGIVLAFGDFIRGFFNCRRCGGWERADLGVHMRCGALDQSKRAQKRPVETQPADRKIFDRALRLRAVQGVGRDADVAHGVMFGSEGLAHAYIVRA
jgi:hypothetical protein